jgi:hypothetical protein
LENIMKNEHSQTLAAIVDRLGVLAAAADILGRPPACPLARPFAAGPGSHMDSMALTSLTHDGSRHLSDAGATPWKV